MDAVWIDWNSLRLDRICICELLGMLDCDYAAMANMGYGYAAMANMGYGYAAMALM